MFTANLFALMGLRQLFFLMGDMLDKLRYLHYGVAFILGFIGVKLILHAMHENELPFINGGEHIEWAPDINNWVSLGVVDHVDGGRHGPEPGRQRARLQADGRRER